ncbi:MAG TPA: radical SAM protein, partial [Firmicutes bacterium]|nr:radical SAM protein [Bacillota bacterium]
ITLPEVLREIESQSGGQFKVEHFAPSGCDHARCGFHGDFVVMPDSSIKPLTAKKQAGCCCRQNDSSGVEKNRNFVARRWVRDSLQKNQSMNQSGREMNELDIFLARVKSHGFTITGMAFQDCWNIDLERLRECSLHVLSPEGKIIPFCAYNISSSEGKSLYRKNVKLS